MAADTHTYGAQATLDGVILCCTSISPEKRTELASIALQMGAVHKYDLTSDVTHLVVGDADTPKYKFVARERPDVKCLLPSWVEALREMWINGGEPDVEALESQHRLPTLHNLRVCVTGFEDMAYRKKLEDIVNDNGGEYRANLTKDVTHLIAKDPSGAKYKFAMDWKIKIVAVEWLEQSLERGMILNENLYSLFLPPSERGHNAWIRRAVSSSSLGKRSLGGNAASNGPRKLRRTASTKLGSQNFGLWTNIVNGEIKTEGPKHNQWSEQLVPHNPEAQAASFATTKSTATSDSSVLPSRPSTLTDATAGSPFAEPRADILERTGIFAGKRLLLHGFNDKKTSVLQKHLLSHGAEILPDSLAFTPSVMSPPDNEYLLVPHDMSYDRIPATPKTMHQPIVVTDMWVERTLHRKQYIRPEANVTNTPFRKFPIPGFDRLVVCSTRFEDVDLLHMSRAVKLMGATYDEEFSPKASVLVCNKVISGHEKLHHAKHWNIPAVTAEWLWDCIRSGELKEFPPYLAQPFVSKPQPEARQVQKQTLGQTKGEKRQSTSAGTETGALGNKASKERSPNGDQNGQNGLADEDVISHRVTLVSDTSKPLPRHPIPATSEPLREITPTPLP